MSFLPDGYVAPASGSDGYFKFKQGDNKFRILGDAETGLSYWTTEKKCVRSKKMPANKPDDIKTNSGQAWDKAVKHFWCLPVWNVEAKKIQVLEITQYSIQQAIEAFVNDAEWGDPKNYDLNVKRKGEGLDTEYSVMSSPNKGEFSDEIKEAMEKVEFDFSVIFDGGNPITHKDEDSKKK